MVGETRRCAELMHPCMHFPLPMCSSLWGSCRVLTAGYDADALPAACLPCRLLLKQHLKKQL